MGLRGARGKRSVYAAENGAVWLGPSRSTVCNGEEVPGGRVGARDDLFISDRDEKRCDRSGVELCDSDDVALDSSAAGAGAHSGGDVRVGCAGELDGWEI